MMIRPLSASPWDQYDLFHFREHLAAVTRHIASEQDGREHSHHRERSSRLGVRWGILIAALSGPDGPLLQLPERLDMLRSDTVGDEPSGGYPERKPLRPADRLRQHDHLVKGRGQSYLLFRRQGHRVEHIPLLEADTGYPHPVTLERATDTCTREVQLALVEAGNLQEHLIVRTERAATVLPKRQRGHRQALYRSPRQAELGWQHCCRSCLRRQVGNGDDVTVLPPPEMIGLRPLREQIAHCRGELTFLQLPLESSFHVRSPFVEEFVLMHSGSGDHPRPQLRHTSFRQRACHLDS